MIKHKYAHGLRLRTDVRYSICPGDGCHDLVTIYEDVDGHSFLQAGRHNPASIMLLLMSSAGADVVPIYKNVQLDDRDCGKVYHDEQCIDLVLNDYRMLFTLLNGV